MKRNARLAASFIVTLGSVGGCAKPEPLPGNPPEPPKTIDSGIPAAPSATASTALAGRVDDEGTTWGEHVVPGPNGKCFKHAGGHCPPGAHCNPPPPRLVDCPDGGTAKK